MMKTFQHIIHSFFMLCLLGMTAFTCNTQAPTSDIGPKPVPTLASDEHIVSKRKLYETIREKGEIVVVYGSQNAQTVDDYIAFAEQLKKNARRTRFIIKKDTEIEEQDLSSKILLLVGTPSSNPIIEQFAAELPIGFSEKGLTFGNKTYDASKSVLSLSFYPNPRQNDLPLSIITGQNDPAIARLLTTHQDHRWLSWSSWDYELYQDNNRIMLGFLADTTWQMDKKVHFDFSGVGDTIGTSEHFTFITKKADFKETKAADLAKNCEAVVQKILAFTEKKDNLKKISYHIYASAEEKGLMIGNTDQSNIRRKQNEAHTVLNDTYQGNYIGKENELVLRTLLGQPRHDALEVGLGIYFTATWQKKGYAYWAAKLFKSDNMIPLENLLNNELHQKGSDLMTGSLSASFVEFLIQYWGKADFLKRYTRWQITEAEVVLLETAWHDYLANTVSQFDFSTSSSSAPSYWKGFNFAHEGYRIYNGYISRKATEALEKMATLGCNATAIVPYSYMRQPNQPTYIPFANSAGGENDESVVHSAFQAKKLGMAVMLKPQIWLGGGNWPGSIEMNSEEDWALFFKNYERWIIHYAMLADIHEMESLCLGVEFVKTTKHHQEAWRKLIKKARGLYGGQLTYAANWGEEFEQITFWEDLDFIGLNSYYPLSKKEEVSMADLEAGFEEVIKKIEKVHQQYQKPIVFTEIGFRSAPRPWKNPHAEGESRRYNGEHQAQCYEVIFKGIQQEEWCKGILWWKYPSYLEYRGIENTSFTPNRKPAEEVVARWFQLL